MPPLLPRRLPRTPLKWLCPQCRLQSTLSSSAAPQQQQPHHPVQPQTYGPDDAVLRRIFDSQDTWKSFNSTASLPTGLFLNKTLSRPGGFREFSDRTLSKAQRLVQDISAGKREGTIIRDLDRLSDMLCSVSDLTGFIRTSHPDRKWASKANETFQAVLEYMNGLNQHESLYESTARATPRNAEEVSVQKGLLHDFEQSGMSLPPDARQKFVSLSSEAIVLEQRFVNGVGPATPYLEFNVDDLRGLHASDLRSISMGTTARLPTSGSLSQRALVLVENEAARKRIWEAQNTGRRGQIDILERFLSIRAELALLTRHSTYAEAKLVDKMAKTPGTSSPCYPGMDIKLTFGRCSDEFPSVAVAGESTSCRSQFTALEGR
jgi:mitochondrial intermediate peptidase